MVEANSYSVQIRGNRIKTYGYEVCKVDVVVFLVSAKVINFSNMNREKVISMDFINDVISSSYYGSNLVEPVFEMVMRTGEVFINWDISGDYSTDASDPRLGCVKTNEGVISI